MQKRAETKKSATQQKKRGAVAVTLTKMMRDMKEHQQEDTGGAERMKLTNRSSNGELERTERNRTGDAERMEQSRTGDAKRTAPPPYERGSGPSRCVTAFYLHA